MAGLYKVLKKIGNLYKIKLLNLIRVYPIFLLITDALSTMLRLLREESEEASWLIQARFRIDPVELCDEEW